MSCPTPIDDVSPATASGRAELATYVEHAQGCASCAAHLERLRHLERELSHLVLDVDPSGSACPSPEGLLVWMAGECADPTEIDQHLVGCASCRGDVLVAVRAGAEAGERRASSRRLAASSSSSSRRKLETTKGSSSSSTRKLSSSSTRKLSSSSTRKLEAAKDTSGKLEAAKAPGSSSSSSRKLAAKRPSSRRGRIQPFPEPAVARGRVWPQRLAAAAILALVASLGFSALNSRPSPTRASAPPATTEQPTAPRPVTPRTTTERTTTERTTNTNSNAWYDDWLSSIDELVAERAAAGTATDAPPPVPPPATPDEGADDPVDPDPDAGSWEPTEAPSLPIGPPSAATETPSPSDPTQPDPAPVAERPLLEIASSRGVRVRLPDEGSWRRLDGTKVPAGATLRASSRGGVVALGTSAIYLGPDARLTVEEDGETLAVASGPMFVEGEENVVLGHALGRVRVNGQAFIASRRGALAMASFAGTLSFEPAEPGPVRGLPRTVTIYPGEQTLATLKEVGETRPMTGDDVARILPDWVTSLRPATLPPVTLPPDVGGAAGNGGELSGGVEPQSGPGRGNPGNGGGAAGGARGAGVGGAAGGNGNGNGGNAGGQGGNAGGLGGGNAGGGNAGGLGGGNAGGLGGGNGNAGGQGNGNAGGNGNGNGNGNAGGHGNGNAGGNGNGNAGGGGAPGRGGPPR